MALEKRDIICLAGPYWHAPWFRKQHFMWRFAKRGHRVLYVEPTFSMVRRNPLPGIATSRFFFPRLEEEEKNLFRLTPPRMFPFRSTEFGVKVNHSWQAQLIARMVRRLRMEDPILWVYRPEYATALQALPGRTLVFDLADDLGAYPRQRGYTANMAPWVDLLARSADLMIVTSPTLLDKYTGISRRCCLIPNGFEASLFNAGVRPTPADLASLPRPIIGFVGTLFSYLDYGLIRAVAEGHPDKSVVLVGPVEDSVRNEVEELRRLPNIHLLGRKPQEQIPAYVGTFDVCINPFRVDDVSRSVSPLKVYEYLACGKPVVSVPMAGLQREEIADLIQFASDPQEFVRGVGEAIQNDTSERAQARVAGVQTHSWDALFEKLYQVCNDYL